MPKRLMRMALVLAILFELQGPFSEARELKQDLQQIKQTRRISQFSWAQELKALRQRVLERVLSSGRSSPQSRLTAQAASTGDSYVNIIPYVTTENNTRTNLGLNNYSLDSVVNGLSPVANVLIGMFDPQGNLAGQGTKTVQSNQMLQTNGIIADLGATAQSGWLLIFSDEPITAWASVIFNSSQDPSIEMAVSDQVYKPGAYVESQGTIYNPLMIQSTTKVGHFTSSLVVANIGSGDGVLNIEMYDKDGVLLPILPPVTIKSKGMYINNDIRSTVPGTFGPTVISVSKAVPSDTNAPRIVAVSIVKSDLDTSGFLPGFALPQTSTTSMAGYYTGSITGSTINAQVAVVLYQERDMIYGTLDVTGGSFPLNTRSFLWAGEIIDNNYLFQTQDAFDSDTSQTFFLLRFFGQFTSATAITGDFIYYDEQNRGDKGTFTLNRIEAIFP
jgi:hypothetical protein